MMQIETYQEAITLLNRYPFFTFAAMRAAVLTDNPDERKRLETLISLQLGASGSDTADSSATATVEISDPIDAFLSNYNSDAPLPYMPAESEPVTTTETGIPADTVNEETARILIKKYKYSEALTIIEQLYLKNPEKSIYFADQIRFLKKLILNQAKATK